MKPSGFDIIELLKINQAANVDKRTNDTGTVPIFITIFGGSDIYFRKILSQVKQFIDASNVIVGEYMCQGRMPQSVRERYLKMKEAPDHPQNLDVLIQNFDCALSHPDANDMEKLKEAVINSSF